MTANTELRPGLTLEQEVEVTEAMSARHLGSGSVGVLATPAMIAQMEGVSMRCVQPFLDDGQTTVGYIVNIRHLAPTAIGGSVRTRATVTALEGRKIRFAVECRAGDKVVGEGEHVRAIIDSDAFLQASAGREK
jgi:fluoroacetyl-CoA thioesterase